MEVLRQTDVGSNIRKNMTNENPNLKLLSISAIYSLFTFFMWMLSKNDESASLSCLFILVIIWAILTIIMGIIIWKDKIKIKNG